MSSAGFKTVTTYPQVLGKVLSTLRERQGLDQSVVANYAGLTQPTWSRIENGRSGLTVNQLARVARALKTTPQQIVKYVEDSIHSIEKKGIKVEMEQIAEPQNDQGMLLIGAMALGGLIAAILSKSK